MTTEHQPTETDLAQHVSEHYRRASDELLHAYQRNKEAFRHHEAGAFKAALHHATLSKHHAFNAHEHMTQAMHISEKIGRMGMASPTRSSASSGSQLQ